MHGESKQGRAVGIDAQTEHLVVLLVAGARRGRTRERLYRELNDLGRRRVDNAITSLVRVGLVVDEGHSVRQSAALARFDWLHFITI
jgi:hypothetical protein